MSSVDFDSIVEDALGACFQERAAQAQSHNLLVFLAQVLFFIIFGLDPLLQTGSAIMAKSHCNNSTVAAITFPSLQATLCSIGQMRPLLKIGFQ